MTLVRYLLLCALAASVVPAQTLLFAELDGSLPPLAASADAIGDLDNDGDQDMVGAGVVLMNDGHGRFTPVATPSLQFYRSRAVLVDLNADGLLDLVSIDQSPGGVRVDLGAPGLTFAGPVGGLPTFAPAGAIAKNLVTGDVDNDGDVDVLIGLQLFNGIHSFYPVAPTLWLNNGAAGFATAPAAALPAVALDSSFLLLRDLDADGDLDAIFAGNLMTAPSVRGLMNAAGTFSVTLAWQWGSYPLAVDLGDFNGDGLPDLIFSMNAPVAGTTIVMNSATGFLGGAPLLPVYFTRIRAVDVNGDGVDEVLGQDWSSTPGLSLRSVTSNPPVVGPPIQSWPTSSFLLGGPAQESVRDLDGDGDRDVLAKDGYPYQALLLMNSGAGTLVSLGGHTAGVAAVYRTITGDLDLDGDVDVAGFSQQGASNLIATGLNDGNGYYAPGPSTPVGLAGGLFYYTLFPFDRDGDGDLDLYAGWNMAFAFGGGPSDTVYDCNGGAFTPVVTIPSTGGASALSAFDFDGDGDQDVLVGRRPPGTVTASVGPMQYHGNLGAAGFAAPTSIGISHHTFDLDLGDFDGNGTMDVFQTNTNIYGSTLDPCVVYLNSGTAAFTAVAQAFSGYYTAAGDLNNDGLADLVVDGQVWFAAGGGSFTPGPLLVSPLQGPPTLSDVDQDGDLDLVETPGTVMYNAGGGVFGPPQSTLYRGWIAPTSWEVPFSSVADVDRDGDLDIIAAPGPRILLNTTRQLARASIPRPGRPGSVDLYGTPGGAWFLFGSTGTTSFSYPPWGTVLIDPASAQLGAMGLFAAAGPTAGSASFGVTLPNNPAIVGSTTYWQAIDAVQMRFTNRLTVTVLGY